MSHRTTAEVIERFNHAFVHHDGSVLADLIDDHCVMEANQPAPDGARYEGRAACLEFWQALAEDRTSRFEPEDVVVAGERATIRWRYRFGDGPADSVRGVNLMHIRNGLIVEALGYSKTTGDVPLAVDGLDGRDGQGGHDALDRLAG
ncbi:nuclear transport factor 2 family protein [Streptomyces fildesensis]|uniref:Nuclear transport factor 2 family protein n=1 Tax=Streptomyces fildesensis TaxID=375757 RepID=A0ABW8CAL5_9ACTN